MNTSSSDEDSEDNQNEDEDLIGNVAFVSYLSINVCYDMQKKTNMLQQKLFTITTIQ